MGEQDSKKKKNDEVEQLRVVTKEIEEFQIGVRIHFRARKFFRGFVCLFAKHGLAESPVCHPGLPSSKLYGPNEHVEGETAAG